MSADSVDIELALRQTGDDTYGVDATLQMPGGNTVACLARDIPITLTMTDLRARTLDPIAYGQALTRMLFGPAPLREAWIKATTYVAATEAPLRVRLRIDPDAGALHALRWETLCDPETLQPLCFSRRILLSRYLDAGDLGRVPHLTRSQLRAIAMIASPHDIEDFNLAPIAVANEARRTSAALGAINLTVLAHGHGQAPASLIALTDELERGATILYLACHGVLRRGEPTLYLEDADGQCARVAGGALVRAIADLPAGKRPLLVVLAACRSAGNGAEDVTGALAPRLAQAGVAAVIGMQGDAPIPTIERLMPRLFTALVEDGAIDRALALARAGLEDSDPWWMPALYLRNRDGRLWISEITPPGTLTLAAPAVPVIERGLVALSRLLQIDAIRDAMTTFRADIEAASAQVAHISDYKQLHDLFQQLEDIQLLLGNLSRRLPDDDAWDEAAVSMPELCRVVAQLAVAAGQASVMAETALWLRRLERIRDDLVAAVESAAPAGLRKVLARLGEVLAQEPARVNASLVSAARALRLQTLAQDLGVVCAQLRQHAVADIQPQVAIFAAGLESLEHLAAQLGAQVQTHDRFQELDNALRQARALLDIDPEVLRITWEDLQSLILQLIAQPHTWAADLAEGAATLSAALGADDQRRQRRAFLRFASVASQSFHQVDVDLLGHCAELRSIGQPLQVVTRLLSQE